MCENKKREKINGIKVNDSRESQEKSGSLLTFVQALLRVFIKVVEHWSELISKINDPPTDW